MKAIKYCYSLNIVKTYLVFTKSLSAFSSELKRFLRNFKMIDVYDEIIETAVEFKE